MNLVLDNAALLGGSSSTNRSSITVKVASNFFKRGVLGLNVEEVDDDEFETEPDAVDNVVLPLDVAQSDGVDVLVAGYIVRVVQLCSALSLTYKNRAMSTIKNIRVMPFARMLYGRISAE